jgi:hypothetical protein
MSGVTMTEDEPAALAASDEATTNKPMAIRLFGIFRSPYDTVGRKHQQRVLEYDAPRY